MVDGAYFQSGFLFPEGAFHQPEATVIVIDDWDWDANGCHSRATLEITSLPEHGTLFYDRNGDGLVGRCEVIYAGWEMTETCQGFSDKVKFMPDADWTGSTTFTYRVTDRCEAGPEAQVTVTVLPPNDPPEAGAFTTTAVQGSVVTVNGWNYTDAQGDAATSVRIDAIPQNGTLFLDANNDDVIDCGETIALGQVISWADATTNGLVKFASAADFSGALTLSYSVKDASDWSQTAVATLQVNQVTVIDRLVSLGASEEDKPWSFDGEDWYVVFINEDGTQRNDGGNGYTYTPTAGRNEIIVGTAGDDIIDCSGLDNRYIILGGDGADVLKGGNNSDYIFGWVTLNWSEYAQYPCLISDSLDQAVVAGTVQTLYGNGGNDFIYGGPADEIIYGDSENGDNSGSDNISGGAGADTIYGDSKTGNGSGSDNIDGQEGNDIIFGDTEYGVGSGNDQIWGSD